MEQQDDIRQAPGRTLAILGVGTLAFVLAQTTVIPALGEMQKELGASASGIAWMVTAYLLVASIATPIFGKLGDMFGKERFLAISLALFAVGSVVCAFADSLGLMIVGRGLQGLGGGVFPLSLRDHPRRVPGQQGADRHRAAGRDLRGRLRHRPPARRRAHRRPGLPLDLLGRRDHGRARHVHDDQVRARVAHPHPGPRGLRGRRHPRRRPHRAADRDLARRRLGLGLGADARA